jgi:hypothetical protein
MILRHRRRIAGAAWPLTVAALVVVSACSSDSDGTSTADSASSTASSPAAATVAPDASDGGATLPVGPDIDADCLQGLWQMDLAQLTNLLQSTYPIPDLRVPLGSASLEFVGGQAIFLAQFRLELDVGTTVLQADADFRRIGDVEISGPNIDLVFTTASGGIDPFVEVNPDGSTEEAPISPTLDPPDLPGVGVVCTADTLSFPESSTGIPGPFVFTRTPA